MHYSKEINRRRFIKIAGAGSSALLLSPTVFTACRNEADLSAGQANPGFAPDLEIDLTAKAGQVSLLDGPQTAVWRYVGNVVKGNSGALVNLQNNYLGPVIKAKRGQKVRINFQNQVDQISIVHWHGMHVPSEMDGHPRYIIKNGETFVYEFEVMDRAGTYWFHPHPHAITGPQVYRGLAGLFLVADAAEEKLNLPSGDYDIPLVIQDRRFDSENQLVYVDNRMERMMGFLGDTILVNGMPNQVLNLESRAYRFRILNGSNSRIYKLAWDNGTPFTVIGTDGGLLEKPLQRPYLTLGPAERYDVIADFSSGQPGEQLRLVSQFIPGLDAGMEGMMGRGMMGGMGRRANVPENGAPLHLLTVKIDRKIEQSFKIPEHLSSTNAVEPQKAKNAANPRRFEFAMGGHMQWTINGKTFEMTKVAKDEKVKLNTTEIWEFINGGGTGMGMMGGMMQMPHPVHIHGLQFRIVERQVDSRFREAWDALKDGVVDEGWKDSFLLLPGARVKVLLSFSDFKGLYLYHCHNLEHEDMGMMRNYLVE